MKLTALAQSPIQHVLVYGPPKTGKTQLLNELVKAGYTLYYVGMENGHDVFYKLSPEEQERVNIINLPDTRDYPIAAETVLKIAKGTAFRICDAHGKIDCPICKSAALKSDVDKPTWTDVEFNKLGPKDVVAYDSMSQLTNSIIAHITKGMDETYKLQQDDWGNLGKLLDIFLGRIQQAVYNCVVISHETEAEMEDGKMKIVPVAGTRNFSRNAAKYFGHVVYSQVANMKHEFKSMTTKTVNIVVGSRTDIDTQTTGSLLPIFEGKIGTGGQTNGQKAAAGLSSLLKKA